MGYHVQVLRASPSAVFLSFCFIFCILCFIWYALGHPRSVGFYVSTTIEMSNEVFKKKLIQDNYNHRSYIIRLADFIKNFALHDTSSYDLFIFNNFIQMLKSRL